MSAFEQARREMVERQLARRGIRDPRVLDAMARVPREAFLPPALAPYAYDDRALPIDCGQTISQPYVVALMIEALHLDPEARVLEVGAGSGYAAAVLATLAAEVYAIERHPDLAEEASGRLARLGYDNVVVRVGDGTLGWPEAAPFEGILVSAAAPEAPPSLLAQLMVGGRMVIPIGDAAFGQEVTRITKEDDGDVTREALGGVRFVPLLGAEGWDASTT